VRLGNPREQIIDLPRDLPPMYKGTCAEEKASKKSLAPFGQNCKAWDWEEMQDPRLLVRNSSPHSMCHAATYRCLAVPRVLVSS